MRSRKIKILFSNIAYLNNNYGAQAIAFTLMKELKKFFEADFTFSFRQEWCDTNELEFAKLYGYDIVIEPGLLNFFSFFKNLRLCSFLYTSLALVKKGKFRFLPKKEKELYKNLREVIEKSDVIMDISGIDCVDFGKGGVLSTLSIYFSLTFYQRLAREFSKLYLKFTKSYGPIYGRMAKYLIEKSFNRLPFLLVRGEKNMEELSELNLKIPVYSFPDISILAEPEKQDWAVEYLSDLGLDIKKPIIGLSPSSVIASQKEEPFNTCGKNHIQLCKKIIEIFQGKKLQVLIIPHSINRKDERYCDLFLAKEIYQSIQSREGVFLLSKPLDYFKVRAIIGLLQFYITSRYHSLVSALCMEVPTVALSWHIKYEDLVSLFLDNFCIINSRTTPIGDALDLIGDYYTDQSWFDKERIKTGKEEAINQVRKSIELVVSEIEKNIKR